MARAAEAEERVRDEQAVTAAKEQGWSKEAAATTLAASGTAAPTAKSSRVGAEAARTMAAVDEPRAPCTAAYHRYRDLPLAACACDLAARLWAGI